MKSKKKKQLTIGWRVISFIHKYCKVPEGALVGQPVILDKFQIKFILDVFDRKHVTKTAILSMARKNGKTALIACIVLAFLVGPVAKLNSQVVSGAMSRDQAGIVFKLCKKMIGLSPELSRLIKIVASKKTLIGLRMNVEYQALSADAKVAHGLSPLVVICDELGQVTGPKSDFFDALETAQGAHENPIMIIISTQAASDADLLSIMIDDAELGHDPHTVCHVYAAPEGCDVKDRKAWAAANPALGNFRSLPDMVNLAGKADRMPSAEARFRNLNLNQRVSTSNPFIARSSWKACGGDRPLLSECSKIYGGLDLSGKLDLTAFVLYGYHEATDRWYSYSWFWTPKEGLEERAHRDRAPYDVWVKQGFIMTTPGASINYGFVVKEIYKIMAGLDILAIAFDRWRIDELKKYLETEEDWPLVEFGQGFKDMAPALDALEEKIVNKRFGHGDNPVLTMCAANAKVTEDPVKNRKLDKIKASGRIDGLVALAMAAGIAEKQSTVETNGNIDDFINNPIVIG